MRFVQEFESRGIAALCARYSFPFTPLDFCGPCKCVFHVHSPLIGQHLPVSASTYLLVLGFTSCGVMRIPRLQRTVSGNEVEIGG